MKCNAIVLAVGTTVTTCCADFLSTIHLYVCINDGYSGTPKDRQLIITSIETNPIYTLFVGSFSVWHPAASPFAWKSSWSCDDTIMVKICPNGQQPITLTDSYYVVVDNQ